MRPSLVTTASSSRTRPPSSSTGFDGNEVFSDALGRFIAAFGTAGFLLYPAGGRMANHEIR